MVMVMLLLMMMMTMVVAWWRPRPPVRRHRCPWRLLQQNPAGVAFAQPSRSMRASDSRDV
jgi:hypothetical protein